MTPINTAAVHASAQQQPTSITHTRQGHHQILSATAARCEALEQYLVARRILSFVFLGDAGRLELSPCNTPLGLH